MKRSACSGYHPLPMMLLLEVLVSRFLCWSRREWVWCDGLGNQLVFAFVERETRRVKRQATDTSWELSKLLLLLLLKEMEMEMKMGLLWRPLWRKTMFDDAGSACHLASRTMVRPVDHDSLRLLFSQRVTDGHYY